MGRESRAASPAKRWPLEAADVVRVSDVLTQVTQHLDSITVADLSAGQTPHLCSAIHALGELRRAFREGVVLTAPVVRRVARLFDTVSQEMMRITLDGGLPAAPRDHLNVIIEIMGNLRAEFRADAQRAGIIRLDA